jgi:hypothetical protein
MTASMVIVIAMFTVTSVIIGRRGVISRRLGIIGGR